MKTVRADSLNATGEPRHESLPDELRERATRVYWRVGKLGRPDLNLAGWIDGFRYDTNPVREIAVWEHIADAFEYIGGRALGPAQQLKMVRALLGLSIQTVDLESQTGLSEAAVLRLRAAWEATHKPDRDGKGGAA